jgi:hypothetical protein
MAAIIFPSRTAALAASTSAGLVAVASTTTAAAGDACVSTIVFTTAAAEASATELTSVGSTYDDFHETSTTVIKTLKGLKEESH